MTSVNHSWTLSVTQETYRISLFMCPGLNVTALTLVTTTRWHVTVRSHRISRPRDFSLRPNRRICVSFEQMKGEATRPSKAFRSIITRFRGSVSWHFKKHTKKPATLSRTMFSYSPSLAFVRNPKCGGYWNYSAYYGRVVCPTCPKSAKSHPAQVANLASNSQR